MGTCLFLFLEVLPALRTGPLIHIHNIPFLGHRPYSAEYWIYEGVWGMWWNESMLLHAGGAATGELADEEIVTESAEVLRGAGYAPGSVELVAMLEALEKAAQKREV
jgi:hypothetical protein